MRQVVLDTETTGIGANIGHRIIEIGCIEILDRNITKNYFHTYLNPQREVDEGAFRVHGLSNEFLSEKPLFRDVASDFMKFIEDSELIIHNAAFDLGFLDMELKRIRWPVPIQSICSVCDTLSLSREKNPGQRHSLDALCKRYDIDNSNRKLHGALLDAEILASVYLAMTGGQGTLFDEEESFYSLSKPLANTQLNQSLRALNVIKANDEELKKHHEFMEFLEESAG